MKNGAEPNMKKYESPLQDDDIRIEHPVWWELDTFRLFSVIENDLRTLYPEQTKGRVMVRCFESAHTICSSWQLCPKTPDVPQDRKEGLELPESGNYRPSEDV